MPLRAPSTDGSARSALHDAGISTIPGRGSGWQSEVVRRDWPLRYVQHWWTQPFCRLLCPVCLMPRWPLAVSLGFFEDVFVPAAQLSQPASL